MTKLLLTALIIAYCYGLIPQSELLAVGAIVLYYAGQLLRYYNAAVTDQMDSKGEIE